MTGKRHGNPPARTCDRTVLEVHLLHLGSSEPGAPPSQDSRLPGPIGVGRRQIPRWCGTGFNYFLLEDKDYCRYALRLPNLLSVSERSWSPNCSMDRHIFLYLSWDKAIPGPAVVR